ncbi:hypothetical protein D3C81_1689760 [compost metagenome]
MLEGTAAQGVGHPRATVSRALELGHQEQADAAHSGRRIGQAGQHQVDDVVGQVLVAAADEDLAATDAIAAIALRLGTGTQQRQVGASLRLGQAHGAGPLAADQLAQVVALQLRAAMPVQGKYSTFGEARVDAKRQRGAHQHFVKTGCNHLRQALAIVFGRAGHAAPALLDIQPVGLAEALGGQHLPLLSKKQT